jgi:FkbM family methyltransferase
MEPKTAVQNLLKRVGLYQRVKSSFAYDLYWRFADPRLLVDRTNELNLFRQILQGLRSGDLIFDIGANIGQKTDVFLRLGARVVAVEPDRSNQDILRKNFLSLRVSKKPVIVVGKAISDRKGVETLWVDAPGSGKNTLNRKWVDTLRSDAKRFGSTVTFAGMQEVETTTLEELIRSHGAPFYIKIDVEGHEVNVLRGLHSAVPYVSFEVNLPEFKPEACECVELLDRIGAGGRFNYVADCRSGLGVAKWLSKEEFVYVLNSIDEPCIDVFWRAPAQS